MAFLVSGDKAGMTCPRIFKFHVASGELGGADCLRSESLELHTLFFFFFSLKIVFSHSIFI